MNNVCRIVVIAFALSFGAAAQAQLSAFVTAGDTKITAKVTFWVNPVSNTLTVEIDNRFAGANNATGTVSSIAFSTPFADGTSLSLVSQTIGSPGDLLAANSPTAAFALKNQTANRAEIALPSAAAKTTAGASTGVKFGEVGTFVFQAPNLDAAVRAGFFDSAPDLAVRWQDVSWSGRSGFSDNGFAEIDWQIAAAAPPTPEPATYGLMAALALAALAVYRRKKLN